MKYILFILFFEEKRFVFYLIWKPHFPPMSVVGQHSLLIAEFFQIVLHSPASNF